MGASMSDCCEPLLSRGKKSGKGEQEEVQMDTEQPKVGEEEVEENTVDEEEFNTETQQQQDPETKHEPEPQPELESEPKPEPQPELESEPKPEPKPETKPEPQHKPKPKPEPQAPVKVVAKPPPEPTQRVVAKPATEKESEGEEDEVAVAGETKLLRLFADGNVLTLTSMASEMSLQIVNGKVDGKGGAGKKAQFVVLVRRKKIVALQNLKDSNAWLKINNDKLSSNGTGDEFCNFLLSQHIEWKMPTRRGQSRSQWGTSAWKREECVALESAKYPGQHVGIKPDGEAKTPSQTGKGTHGRFVPMLFSPTVAREGELLQLFETGNEIILTSVSSEKSLRIIDKKVDGNGGKGKKARFVVHVRRKGVVALQNVKEPKAWLKILENHLLGNGNGDRLCEFKVREVEGFVVLESVAFPGHHIGILPDGEPKPSNQTGGGEHGRFIPTLKPEGGSGVLSRFEEGNRIVLKSEASGKTVRIVKGNRVEGRGERGALAQFTVHVRGPRVVSLQNIKYPNCWLRIRNNELQPNGKGGKFTRFRLHEIDGGFVAIESVVFPGQHVGILPDGDPKPSDYTGRGEHGKFTPIVIEDAGVGDDDSDEEGQTTL